MLTAKDIKKKLNKIMALGLAALLLLDISSVKAQAAGSSTVSVGIEVQSELSGDKPEKAETFTYEITPGDMSPITSNTTVKITGSGKASFDKIEFDKVGEYKYIIRQIPGTDANYTYDSTEYNVTVAIISSDDGTLTPIITVAAGKEKAKRTAVEFVNEYKAPTEPTTEPEKTTEPETSTEPESSTEPTTEPESSTEPTTEPEKSTEPESSTEPEKTTTTEQTPTPPTPNNETTTTTTTTTTTNNTTTYVPVVPKLVVNTESPSYENINSEPVPLATLTTLVDEETPLAVITAPKTGDTFNMITWLALLAASAIIIVAVIAKIFLRERKK